MNAPIASELEWHEFLHSLAEILPGPIADLEPASRLIDDVGLDSLGLAELIVLLTEKYGQASLSRQLDDRIWTEVTLGMLFQECRGADPRTRSRNFSSTA